MPQTESKYNKQTMRFIPTPLEKDTFNPFPEIYDSNYCITKAKSQSPKISKKAGKCFQLILICQKLLKPFSSHKTAVPGAKKMQTNHKEKSKSTPQINLEDRLKIHKPIVPIQKVDASIQTNIQPDMSYVPLKKSVDLVKESPCFLKDLELPLEDYWDLDIDSAIVGDYNSLSDISLEEQIDPHYATIKTLNDSKSIGQFDCVTDPFIFNTKSVINCSLSSASSPQSGIYSKINKSNKKDERQKLKMPIYNYKISKSNSKLNFDQIMVIKNQLGLSPEMYAFDHNSKLNFPSNEFILYPSFVDTDETPALPKRNYGSSVINFITKLREEKIPNHSNADLSITKNSLAANSDDISRMNNIYSPIWDLNKIVNENTTPASEPLLPRRSFKPKFDHLNPIFKDDSSEDASSISFYSPFKNKYSYPRNFSENYSLKPFLKQEWDALEKDVFVDEMDRFRHVDSEVDVNISYTNTDKSDICVPLDFRRSDLCALEDKLFLEPLMERSFEEDYFLRDIASSLEYINV